MKASYAKRGGGKVMKAAKSSGGGGKSAMGDMGTATSGSVVDIDKKASYGKNASVRETRLPKGGCPRGSKAKKY